MTFHCASETLREGSEELDENLAILAEAPHAKWGPCHSCSCRGFRSRPAKDNICGDCGHHWDMHY